MERDKVIKLSIAGVIGAAAVVLLAMQLLGGRPKQAESAVSDEGSVETERRAGSRAAPPGG